MLLRKAVVMIKLFIKYSLYSGRHKDYPIIPQIMPQIIPFTALYPRLFLTVYASIAHAVTRVLRYLTYKGIKIFHKRSTNIAAFCTIQSMSFNPPPLPFQATKIIKPLNSRISANETKGIFANREILIPLNVSLMQSIFWLYRILFGCI